MRVCSSILEDEGFQIETITSGADNYISRLDRQDLNLVIASYPQGTFIFDSLRKLTVPVIVLTDHISEEVVSLLQGLRKSYCMTKPLDFTKFKTLVKQLMNGESTHHAGYDIL
jgi:DNA-binding response OmpR family regulator